MNEEKHEVLLPPLPDFPAHARLYTTGLGRRTYRRAATTPGEGAPLVLVSEAKAIARAYGQQCADAVRHDADAAKRLRLICKMVGIESHVPADDETLWGAAFAVLGQIRAALEAARQPAPVTMPPAAWAAESTTGGAMRMLTKISLLESEVDRYVNREDMARIGCGRVKVPLYRAAPLVDYTVLHEWANAKGVSYNELCAVVRAATNRSQPAQVVAVKPWHLRVDAQEGIDSEDAMQAEISDWRAAFASRSQS